MGRKSFSVDVAESTVASTSKFGSGATSELIGRSARLWCGSLRDHYFVTTDPNGKKSSHNSLVNSLI